ncbi:MAG: hypothetical protein LBP51_07215, partial [Deferribacteraceae bacterium]|nr:hypothetical protein [Deferribacteraceae bacterium]
PPFSLNTSEKLSFQEKGPPLKLSISLLISRFSFILLAAAFLSFRERRRSSVNGGRAYNTLKTPSETNAPYQESSHL